MGKKMRRCRWHMCGKKPLLLKIALGGNLQVPKGYIFRILCVAALNNSHVRCFHKNENLCNDCDASTFLCLLIFNGSRSVETLTFFYILLYIPGKLDFCDVSKKIQFSYGLIHSSGVPLSSLLLLLFLSLVPFHLLL
eukprot:Phypoly_transcript_11928.p1 GENE.Phypoly_transcript_11928~~Phypoly_transcript_11928.p1  ORF type:complete len:137 (+),score=12.02 Phypoly_transcript_11928:429-839(+)